MTALTLTLLVALAAPGAGSRARPPRPPAESTSAADAGTAAPSSAAPAPLSDAEVESRVRTYLSTIDTPIRAAQWKELGPRAVGVLQAVVQDPDALPSRRAKALDGLSILGGDQARKVVLDTAHAEGEPYGVRASAMRGAARMLSKDDLVKELRPVLESSRQASVRATAAEVLARHAGTSACNAVRAQAAREKGGERRQFTKALEHCSAD